MQKLTLSFLVLVASLMVMRSSATADIIYRNSTNDLGVRFDPLTYQVGDEIVLAGSARYLTNFSFEYWGTNTGGGAFAGTVEARVRFYLNDGSPYSGYPTPGTMFYDSGWSDPLPTTDRSTLIYTVGGGDFGPGGLLIPAISNMTWTVQFQGMLSGDSVGLDLYSPPTVGDSVPTSTNLLNPQDYWLNNSGWQLVTNGFTMNFGATFDASPDPVPEPAMIPLFLAGGLAMFAHVRKLRRSN